jgi:hypothetical protein
MPLFIVGKIKDNDCCETPVYATVYLGLFRFKMCMQCNTLICDMPPVLEWIFMNVVGRIWQFYKLTIPKYAI